MPKIKLKQARGEYEWRETIYVAGQEYEVDNKTAYHLVLVKKVAEEIGVEAPEPTRPDQGPFTGSIPVPEEAKLKIALVRIGGIGDSLELTLLATAVKRKYPDSHVTCFIRDKAGRDLIYDNPVVDQVVITGNVEWLGFVDKIREKDYDIVYDSRYVTKTIHRDKTLRIVEQAEADAAFAPYAKYYDGFIRSCNELTKDYKKHSHDLVLETANLQGTDDDFYIRLDPEDMKMLPLLGHEKYVTIHNGADISRQTKCWASDKWAKVVKALVEKGYKVVQLGNKFEDEIPSAIIMNGRTTIKECVALISKAEFHIDTEGGLVHIARAVRTRSVVLFGPTPVDFFGYKENINIETLSGCRACWWTSDFWWRECPQGYELPPQCMAGITPDMVMDGVEKIEEMPRLEPKKEEIPYNTADLNEKFAMDMALDEAHYRAEQWQWDRIYTMMDMVKGPKILEIGAGDGYTVQVLKKRGFEVTATEISKIRLARMQDQGIEAEWADVNELPYPDNTFDTVIVGEVLEHLDSMAKGLAEAERVCKPDGRIILSLPVAREHDLFEGHKWAIEHHSILKQGSLNMIVLGLDRINRK